jgi:bacteriorhodopsin
MTAAQRVPNKCGQQVLAQLLQTATWLAAAISATQRVGKLLQHHIIKWLWHNISCIVTLSHNASTMLNATSGALKDGKQT